MGSRHTGRQSLRSAVPSSFPTRKPQAQASLLEEYQATVDQVAALQDKLEEEKSELVTSQYELEEEEAYLLSMSPMSRDSMKSCK